MSGQNQKTDKRIHSIPHFSYLDTSKDPCYHDGNLIRTSGSVVEYRLAKARVAGSNPVSCFYKNERKEVSFGTPLFFRLRSATSRSLTLNQNAHLLSPI